MSFTRWMRWVYICLAPLVQVALLVVLYYLARLIIDLRSWL